MGLFTWLRRKMFGEAAKASTPAAAAPSAPAAAPSAPAAPVAPLSPEVLQQFQQMIQALSGADWYYERNQQNIGPFTLAQLQQLLAAGQLRGDDVVWRPGTARVPLSQVLPASFPPLPAAPAEAPVAPPPTSAPPAAASNSPDWFYAEDNKNRKGPFSLGQLRWMSQTGALGPTAMVWRQGLPRWVQLVSVEGMDFPLPRTPPSDEIRYTPATPIGPPPGSIEQAVEWYYLLPGYRGPSAVTSLAFIKSNVRTGQIDRNAMVWRYGLPGWVPMTSVAGITFPSVGTAPPPPPVSPPAASSAPAVSAPPRPAPAPAPPRAAPAPPRPGELQLEAGDFLPITQSDLKQQAKEMGTWSPWFGRRDLIPPADDVRTKLIDRALVSNGLLSPEQLIEIHTVGAEMDRVRPTLVNIEQQAYRSGEAAVQAERDRKARLKAEKKAESERRKKERAEAVARRKATDIVFLGRGVSKQLSDRTSDVAKLSALGLPVLATPAELAAALGLSVPRLRWLAFHAEVAARIHYVNFTVPKKSGGIRTLSAPHRTLAAAQQ